MKFLNCYAFSVAAFIIVTIAGGQEDPDQEDQSRTYRFHNNPVIGRECRSRGANGVCAQRSHCKKALRRPCRRGLNPIVCCEELIEQSTTKAPKKRVTPQPVKENEVDITFPGCGLRSPSISEHNSGSRPTNTRTRNRGGILSGFLNGGTRSAGNSGDLRNRLIEPAIVGGVTSKPNSWPWMVAIYRGAGKNRYLCGASLISKRYVLTAAHCFTNQDLSQKFTVMVGSHTTKDGTEYPVEKVIVHPRFKQPQYYNDICVLKLGRDVDLGKKVYPVCLPSSGLRSQITPNQNNVTVTGWGDTTFGGVHSQELQEVTIQIVPLRECNTSYSKIPMRNFPNGISEVFMCAGAKEGKKDACQGDSGGPLVYKLEGNKYVQLGIVSFGYGCAQEGFPGVYTRVSKYGRWIQENTDLGNS